MREVDLWGYLPPVLKEFKEMVEIMGTEKPEFQLLVQNLDNLMNDAFIMTATVKGIARWESILKITPDSSASLENRRSTVLAKWWNMTPYTKRTLKNRIATIQGNDNVQIEFSPDDPYLLMVTTQLEESGQVDDLIFILETMCPANMGFHIENTVTCQSEMDLINGFGMGTLTTATIKSDIEWQDYNNHDEEEEVNDNG